MAAALFQRRGAVTRARGPRPEATSGGASRPGGPTGGAAVFSGSDRYTPAAPPLGVCAHPSPASPDRPMALRGVADDPGPRPHAAGAPRPLAAAAQMGRPGTACRPVPPAGGADAGGRPHRPGRRPGGLGRGHRAVPAQAPGRAPPAGPHPAGRAEQAHRPVAAHPVRVPGGGGWADRGGPLRGGGPRPAGGGPAAARPRHPGPRHPRRAPPPRQGGLPRRLRRGPPHPRGRVAAGHVPAAGAPDPV